jgi:hypothetical protein
VSDKRSALDTPSAAEKATVLDELLAARPDLRELAEAYAAQVMTDADRAAVADDVEDALQGLDIEELNTRAGYRPGRGYVHPVPLEYSIEWLTCAIANRLDVVMVGWPGAAQDRLPADSPATRPGCPGIP